MNASTHHLEHAGLVTGMHNGRITISLTGSGCSACHKSLCMLGESKAKEVDIPVGAHRFKIGDEVMVKINPSSGYKAVLMLYLVPFALMMVMLWTLLQIGYQEGIAGLSSLLILVPYFILLYLLKSKLSSQCTIDVEKK